MDEVLQKNDPLAAVRIAEFRNLVVGRFLFVMGFCNNTIQKQKGIIF